MSQPRATLKALRGKRSVTAYGWAAAVLIPGLLEAQFVYTENFTGTTAPGWEFARDTGSSTSQPGPRLTAGLAPVSGDPENGVATQIDASGSGWLRLATNTANQANAVALAAPIPSSSGTIKVSFDFAFWGSGGLGPADGVTVFMWDAGQAFDPGSYGGSLGYAQRTDVDPDTSGLAGAYVGVGLDVWGNFSSGSEGRVGGPGQRPNEVVTRGPGTGTTGYDYLAGTGGSNYTVAGSDITLDPGDPAISSLGTNLSFGSATTRPDQDAADYRSFQIELSPTNQLTVRLQSGATGALTDLYTVDMSTFTRPEQLRIGFSGGTGGGTQVYEIRNLKVEANGGSNTFYWDDGNADQVWAADNTTGSRLNWNTDSSPNAVGTNVIFSDYYTANDSSEIISISGTRTIGNAFFTGTDSYTLGASVGAGTITFDNTDTNDAHLTIYNSPNGNANHTVNSNITANDNLFIDQLVDQSLTLAGNVTMTNSKSLNVESTGTVTISGVIADGGGTSVLNKQGAGTLILSGTNTYDGNTTINDGILEVRSNAGLGATSGNTIVNSGGTLALYGGRTIAANETLTMSGAGYDGLGAIRSTNGDNTFNGATTLNANSSVGADAGTTLRMTGVIGDGANTFGLTKVGAGTAVLSGTNTYNGDTTVRNGTLQLNANAPASANGTLGNATTDVVVGDSGTLASDNAALLIGAAGVTVARNITVNNVGSTATLGGNFSGTGTSTISGNVSLNRDTLLTSSTTGSTTFSGVVSGSGGIEKVGTGVVTLSGTGANTFTGTTEVSAGTLILSKTAGTNAIAGTNVIVGDGLGGAGADILQLGAANQINDAAALTINSSGRFDLNNNAETIGSLSGVAGAQVTLGSGTLTAGNNGLSTTYAGTITGTGGLTKTGGGSLTLSGTNTYTGNTNLNAGYLQLGANNALGGVGSDLIFNGGTLVTNGYDFSLDVFNRAGTGAIDFGGSDSKLTFASATGSGATTLYNWAGTPVTGGGSTQLKVNSATAPTVTGIEFAGWGAATTVGTSGNFEIVPSLSGFNEWDGGGLDDTWGNPINWVGNTPNPNGAGVKVLFQDLDTGNDLVQLTDNRTVGTMVLNTSSSAYDFRSDSATTRTLTFDASPGATAYLTVLGSQQQDLGSSTTNLVNIALADNLLVTNNSTATTGLQIGASTADASTFSLGTFNTTFVGAGATVINSQVTGTGSLTLFNNPTGSVRLNDSNTYSGGTTVNAGILQIGNDGALGTGGLTINGGTLQAAGGARTVSSLSGYTINADFTVNGGNNLSLIEPGTLNGVRTITVDTVTFQLGQESGSNDLTGTGGIVKSGSGTLTLGGDQSTFSGGLTVNQGTVNTPTIAWDGLTLGATDSGNNYLGTGAITVNTGGTLSATVDANPSLGGPAQGDITIATGGVVTNSGGTINLTATDSTASADFNLNGTFAQTGGTSTLATRDDFNMGANSRLTATGGTVNINADATFVTAGTSGNAAQITVSNGATVNVNLTGAGVDGNEFTLGQFDRLRVDGATSNFNITGESTTPINLNGRTELWNGATLTAGPGTTFLGSTSQLDGGTGATKGTLIVSGDLSINEPAVSNRPNLTLNIANGVAAVDSQITAPNANSSITNLGVVTKSGAGTTQINANVTNIEASRIDVNAGTLLLAANQQIANSTDLGLGGGTFATGGFSETLSSLTLSANSTIDMGSATSILRFQEGGTSVSGTETLFIANWSGTPLSGGGTDRILFASTLSSAFLSQVQFAGFPKGAIQLSSGEIVPIPEPKAIAGGLGLLGFAFWDLRRRRRK